MRAADRQRDLAGMARLSRDGLQQQRPAGNRFASMNRISQTHEQAPPIVDQSNAASEQPAALQVLCREPAPAPLVFQFVEPVLAVRPIAIQLTQGQNFAVQRGDQRGVFPDLAFASDIIRYGSQPSVTFEIESPGENRSRKKGQNAPLLAYNLG